MSNLRFHRVLLKLSGELLSGETDSSYKTDLVLELVGQIKELTTMGVQVGIVIGGGNFYRGVNEKSDWLPRPMGDRIGMMATVMNGIALHSALEHVGVSAKVYSSFHIEGVAPRYDHLEATKLIEQGHVLIFVGGTGHPFVSTDTGAAIRANEIQADVIMKATKVDGVYDSDPKTNPNAKKYKQLSFLAVLQQKLRVIDSTAVSFCRDYSIPILVFDFFTENSLKQAILDESVGTVISDTPTKLMGEE